MTLPKILLSRWDYYFTIISGVCISNEFKSWLDGCEACFIQECWVFQCRSLLGWIERCHHAVAHLNVSLVDFTSGSLAYTNLDLRSSASSGLFSSLLYVLSLLNLTNNLKAIEINEVEIVVLDFVHCPEGLLTASGAVQWEAWSWICQLLVGTLTTRVLVTMRRPTRWSPALWWSFIIENLLGVIFS